MRLAVRMQVVAFLAIGSFGLAAARAQDWPQWRGPARDARATGFEAPAMWPEQLTVAWKVTVGDGVATPALVGQRLYVFGREGDQEVLRCLDAATGQEIWRDGYPAEPPRGPAGSFAGPRSSPAVAEGKVVAMGVQGTLSCWDAETGEVVWRNRDYEGSPPRFAAASSPILVDGTAIAQVGSEEDGGLAAYDLATGQEKWKWDDEGTAYGSPVLMEIDGTRVLVAITSESIVAIDPAGGELLWRGPNRQGRYNTGTPLVAENQVLIYAGPERGITAVRLERQGDEVSSSQVWRNTDNSLQFNTPVLKDGRLYGISNLNSLFCVDVQSGETLWSAPLGAEAGAGQRRGGAGTPSDGSRRRPARRGRGGGGGGGYGSVVDAGSVLVALTPDGQLVIFEPSGEAFRKIAGYQVADEGTYAYPVLAGHGLYIKDRDSVSLATLP